MERIPAKESVLDANIAFHTSLSNTYKDQPHYLPENRSRVSGMIKEVVNRCGRTACIDLGCGTGFMIDIVLPLFQKVYGIDVTPAMMSHVDLSSGKVCLIEANTETIPLKDKVANMITSNSFLHHLWDIKPTIHEAFRLLKPGGVFFSEEDPNILFWHSLKTLSNGKTKDLSPAYLPDEIASVMGTHYLLGEKIGVDPDTVKLAEYQKIVKGGMDAYEIKIKFGEAGFSEVNVDYYWFLGQGKVAKRSQIEAEHIEAYLRDMMPLTNKFFKYLRIVAWK